MPLSDVKQIAAQLKLNPRLGENGLKSGVLGFRGREGRV